ncbi:uncharacterized protein Ecym_8203 [Eremothecium cymbalariae DBVPG|uniref:Uncharacterized protein n=1 Tax=Eremothecium cymbalariae (strain CBS 270.75 / DBVPG 7215 / KCTC 17166 / NRRL Y-17582) TaxID=931890 RepID=G8JXB4_ERECY|nr:Hypothetical protein Ecym_8203 [Eremothecium cymbalariae DBVPG\
MLQTRSRRNADNQFKMMSNIEESEDEKKLETTEPAPLILSEVESDDDSLSINSDHDSFPDWQKLVYERLGARDQTTMKAIIINFEKTGIVDLSNIDSNFLESFRTAFLSAQVYLQQKGCIDKSNVKEHFGITNIVRILSGRTLYEEPICSIELLDQLKQPSTPHHSYNLSQAIQKPPYESQIPLAERITLSGLEDCGSGGDSTEHDSNNTREGLPFLVDDFEVPYSELQSPVKRRNNTDNEKEDSSNIKRPRVA